MQRRDCLPFRLPITLLADDHNCEGSRTNAADRRSPTP